MIALTAIGNRAWGDGTYPHWVGVALMAMGAFIGSDYPVWSLAPIFASLYLWRILSSEPWLHVLQGRAWGAAIERSLTILPYGLLITMLSHHKPYHAIASFAAVPFTAIIYWACGKQKWTESVALAEILVGAMVGAI